MAYRFGLISHSVLSAFAAASVVLGCGGTTGGGGETSTGGAGTSTGGQTGGSGGDVSTEPKGECATDSDCVAASQTDHVCYSPGCSLPTAASKKDLLADSCLVAWEGTTAPPISSDCQPAEAELACPASCAVPPTCILAYCREGACALVVEQTESTCVKPPAPGADCDALDAARQSALDAARECLVGGIVAECTEGQTVPNECGCPVLVNDNQSDKVAKARAAHDAWKDSCPAPEKCQLVDCAQDLGGGQCQGTNGMMGICTW